MGEAAPTVWRDRKRYLWPLALLMPLLPFVAVFGYSATGWAAFLWIGPLVILGLIPLLDLAVGLDPSSPPDAAIDAQQYDSELPARQRNTLY